MFKTPKQKLDTDALEKAVSDAIEDIEKDEAEIDNLIDEAFKDDEEEKVQKVISDENLIFKEITEHKSDLTKFRSAEHNHFIEVMKELHFLKKHYMKITGTLILVSCFGAYVAGTQHAVIAPYVMSTLEVVNVFKGKAE